MVFHMFGNNKRNEQDVKIIEKEFCSFYEYCKANGFSDQEMKMICKPLQIFIEKSIFFKYLKYLIYIITVFFILYGFFQTETVSWNLSALGRLAMIKILPIWDWQHLQNKKCLISNIFQEETTSKPTNFDCNLCESIDKIPIEFDIDPYELSELYLDVNVPVILTDGLKNYPANINVTGKMLTDVKLAESIPCEQSSNMILNSGRVENILLKTFKFKKWFIHFQNCDFDAVKQFRLIAPRPYFLRPEILPVQYSWVIMSKNYQVFRYKKINLLDKIAVFGQLEGSNFIRLIPRLNCMDECPILETELKENEVIVFTSLWDLEYKPNHLTHNVAFILETH